MSHPTPSYPYRTTREDLRIPLSDGTLLFARIWRPVTDEPVSAVLEYSAGRLTDWTAADDARRHPWYAGHGHAGVRVDLRGHGNSDGLPGDVLADGAEVIAWLAARPWCTGRIGLLGHGPGATTALALAARAPDTVRAVVASHPEGGHHHGGALLADGLHTRAAARLADGARPPDPRYTGDDWRRMWLERLHALEPPAHSWLAEPPGPAPAPVPAPVLAVSSWTDPSCTAVLRLVEDSPAPTRVLIGAWPPGLPDDVLPETLRWWDQWLSDIDTGILGEPALRSRLGRRWTGDDPWPSPAVRTVHYGLDGPLRTAGTASDNRFVHVRSPQHTGLNAGAHRPLGRAADLPPDQREEDGRSVCFDSVPLPEPLELLGAPSLRLRLRPAAAGGHLTARLCDVAPDGTSTLITRGVLATAPAPAPSTESSTERTVEATLDLAAAGHALPPGHRLRLALSSAYWPWIWPGPDTGGFNLDPSHSTLALPVRHPATDAGSAPVTFRPPQLPEPPPVHLTEPLTARPERLTIHDIARHEWRTELTPAADGTRTHPDGLVRDEHTVTAYRILADDPLSAEARTDHTLRMERPDIGWDITLQTRTELRCDATHFIARTHLTALEAGTTVFTRTWQQRFPRRPGTAARTG
ncbi:CocE/NonD family hydrolase [Kitasatospora sp. NPDC052868]|uniref:CocE/NonD family hydrolase n=1 Tax=Kitasatospora sp. NPDC052868 TaxID=3364060 RepID=UPI0037C7504B